MTYAIEKNPNGAGYVLEKAFAGMTVRLGQYRDKREAERAMARDRKLSDSVLPNPFMNIGRTDA